MKVKLKRGPNEIYFLVLCCINNHVAETVEELHIISDICPGQRRNHTVVIFLATLAANGRFNKIFQYFPVRLPCDRNSGLIRNVIHKINRMCTPEKYRKLIEQSTREGKFSVTMCNDSFSTEPVIKFLR
jgi:hypothetical protein